MNVIDERWMVVKQCNIKSSIGIEIVISWTIKFKMKIGRNRKMWLSDPKSIRNW